MKTLITLLFISCPFFFVYGQESLFSFGYGKTFVTTDSSTINLTIDLNRIPGKSESLGGIFFANEPLGGSNSKWGYYWKPTIDVNLGSGVSSAPNNIAIGTTFGFANDLSKAKAGIFTFLFEISPEIIADKSFNNKLHYVSIGPYIDYEFLQGGFLLHALVGLNNANGFRQQIEKKEYAYGRLTMPIIIKMAFWPTSHKGKDYKRISLSNRVKLNKIYKDDFTITKQKNYFFNSTKFDFYFLPNVGVNFTYNYGYEEPVFKKNNAYSIGLTIAR